jgi:signal peptidase II
MKSNKAKMPSRLLAYLPAAVLFLLDRVTKRLIETGVSPFETRVVIPHFFNIVHTRNQGAAFGMLADASSAWRTFVLVAVSGVVLILVAGFLWRVSTPGAAGSRTLRWALSLVLGGALGNLYDRIVCGGMVTDFLEFYVSEFHWPTFNVADSAITVGALLLLADLWVAHQTAKP